VREEESASVARIKSHLLTYLSRIKTCPFLLLLMEMGGMAQINFFP
jgi:hypothetical protein